MDKPALRFELYTRMFRTRAAEELIVVEYPKNEMKTPMHMSMGEEAIAAGVCLGLGESGQVFSSYRSHAVYITKTNETDQFFAELYGRASGTAGGKAGSMHLSNPPLGYLGSSAVLATCIPVAIGAAFANMYNKRDRIVATFFGEGATDEGVFWESVNAAAVMRLPIVFVCEDNGFAIHTSASVRQGYRSLVDIVAKFDVAVYESESTDAEELFNLTRQAAQAIRETRRPAFFRFKYYRYLEHIGVGTDFDAGYRPEDEFKEWQKRDPLVLMRKKILADGMSEEALLRRESEIRAEVHASHKRAETDPLPDPKELYTHVFS